MWKYSRNIILGDDVTPKSISSIITSIIQFNEEDKDKRDESKIPIKLFINTNGGTVYDAFALIDIMQKSQTPIYTYALGKCFSCGFVIFINGHKRFVGKNAFALWHITSGGTYGSTDDIEVDLKRRKAIDEKFESMVVEKTNITQEQLDENRKMKQDWYFNSDECIEFGIANELFEEL